MTILKFLIFIFANIGSTCEGLHHLEENGVRSAFIKAIEGATKKCRETAKKH